MVGPLTFRMKIRSKVQVQRHLEIVMQKNLRKYLVKLRSSVPKDANAERRHVQIKTAYVLQRETNVGFNVNASMRFVTIKAHNCKGFAEIQRLNSLINLIWVVAVLVINHFLR